MCLGACRAMKRRTFLEGAVSAAATLTCFPATLAAIERETVAGRLERRSLGQTGEKLSILGFGSFVLNGLAGETASRLVRDAVEAGGELLRRGMRATSARKCWRGRTRRKWVSSP